MVRGLGVEFRQNTTVGRDVTLSELEKQFDAVFIGVGLGETWDLQLPGRDLEGVIGAMEFIEPTKVLSLPDVSVGRRVACIGAGNTAIDVVTAAKRLGAEIVHLIYRRAEQDMPAFRYEYDLAKLDGVRFHWHTQPVRILGDAGQVAAIECIRTQFEPASGTSSGEARQYPGQRIQDRCGYGGTRHRPETRDGIPSHRGWNRTARERHVIVNEQRQTGNAKYFAGGDCVNGGKEVVDAVAEGMAAARGIDAWLGAPRGKN